MLKELFKFAGYTPTADHDSLVAQNQHLSEMLSQAQQRATGLAAINATLQRGWDSDARKLEDAQDAIQMQKAQIAWCVPDLAMIPPTPEIPSSPVVPNGIQANIQAFGTALVRPHGSSLFDLCHLERFARPSRWALYWVLAHAALATIKEAKALTDENGLSDTFINVLAQQITDLPKVTGNCPPLELGVTPIFQKKKPAIKEDVVGADILLVVAGAGLLPTEGARLIWLQAKLCETKNPYQLDYWRPANSKSIFQYDALRAMHQPDKGSLSIYTQYSSILPFVICASVGQMPAKAPPTQAESKFDMNLAGYRLQEYVTAATCADSIGTFATADDVLAFIKEKTNGSLLPLNVLTVCANDDPHARRLLYEIQHHFEVEMGIVPKREQTREIERGWGR